MSCWAMSRWAGRDYWTALRLGYVTKPEARAVELLTQVCDRTRVNLYCSTGVLIAMGNITRHLYGIHRSGAIFECDEDGRPTWHWCIRAFKDGFAFANSEGAVPHTDNVIAMRNLLEGEELVFRSVGNRRDIWPTEFKPNLAVFASFLPDNLRKKKKHEDSNHFPFHRELMPREVAARLMTAFLMEHHPQLVRVSARYVARLKEERYSHWSKKQAIDSVRRGRMYRLRAWTKAAIIASKTPGAIVAPPPPNLFTDTRKEVSSLMR